ncbi:hypothetical protein HDV57DRAFT_467608 [Trichoderma longibrachiatum]
MSLLRTTRHAKTRISAWDRNGNTWQLSRLEAVARPRNAPHDCFNATSLSRVCLSSFASPPESGSAAFHATHCMHSSEPPGKRSYGFGLRDARAHVARIVCPASRYPNADHPWRGGVTIPYHAEHMRRLVCLSFHQLYRSHQSDADHGDGLRFGTNKNRLTTLRATLATLTIRCRNVQGSRALLHNEFQASSRQPHQTRVCRHGRHEANQIGVLGLLSDCT